jgi:hypothetical protein
MTASDTTDAARGGTMWPLYAAGFTTAFGAHGIAAQPRRLLRGPWVCGGPGGGSIGRTRGRSPGSVQCCSWGVCSA